MYIFVGSNSIQIQEGVTIYSISVKCAESLK